MLLQRNRKGKKPNVSAALIEGKKIQVLYGKDLLGKFNGRSAFKHAVVSQHNPFRVTIEEAGSREKCVLKTSNFVKLPQLTNISKCNERESKSRSGNDPWNVRAFAPKVFAVPNNDKCPVKVYKVYAEKRSIEMKTTWHRFTWQ